MTFCQCAGKPAIGVAAMEQSVASPRLATENAETSLRHTDHFRPPPTELKSSVLEGVSVYGADNHKGEQTGPCSWCWCEQHGNIDVADFLASGPSQMLSS